MLKNRIIAYLWIALIIVIILAMIIYVAVAAKESGALNSSVESLMEVLHNVI